MTDIRPKPFPDLPRAPGFAGDGFVIVDKPVGVTSHDVVAAVRRLAGTKKVGHAGTLDPAASGVLVLGVGAGTRLLTFVSGADKDYSSVFRLGQATDTEDATGTVIATPGVEASDDEIDAALRSLTGRISQVPSAYSAKKIGGKKAYELARAGETVELAAVDVTVSLLERTGTVVRSIADGAALADFPVEVSCSSGTFIRALARQVGERLGSAGHITALRRTRVGGFSDAVTVEALAAEVADGRPMPLLPLAEVAAGIMPTREISETEERALRYGQFIDLDVAEFPVALVRGGRLVAIGVRRGAQVGPAVVFPA